MYPCGAEGGAEGGKIEVAVGGAEEGEEGGAEDVPERGDEGGRPHGEGGEGGAGRRAVQQGVCQQEEGGRGLRQGQECPLLLLPGLRL